MSFVGAVDPVVVRRMNSMLHRRGPDGEGYLVDGPVALGMRRLAVIDLDGGWQPVYNEDRSVGVVFNGEIYNYREVRERLQLAGHRFTTSSDTEVIAHLYEEHGLDFVQHLQGMFAIALWDSRTRRLILTRDRLGIKPLYLARVSGEIIFGSELKAVLARGCVPTSIDEQALDAYLAYGYIPAPLSIYSSVRKLRPATLLVVDADGSETERRYWSLGDAPPLEFSEEEWVERTESALQSAVASHLVSDVPVGAFLSGGVDSGLVAAMMARDAREPVKTFTIGFKNAGSAFIDERPYARELAVRYGFDHHDIEVEPSVDAVLPDIVAAFDEPFADDSVIPSYYVSQATRAHVKVALSGLGGDELFAGYRRHLGVKWATSYRSVPPAIRNRVVAPLVRRLPELRAFGDRVDQLKRFALADAELTGDRYLSFMTTCPTPDRRQLLAAAYRERVRADATAELLLAHHSSCGSRDPVECALRTDLGFYLPDDILALSDRLSMWHSLELRVPFVDHKLVEFAARIPSDYKIRGNTQKYLLKRVAQRWLPDAMIDHRKQGFEAPMSEWLRGPLRPRLEELIASPHTALTEMLSLDRLRVLAREHVAGRQRHSKVLFAALVLDEWCRARPT